MKTKVLPRYAQIDEAATGANLKRRIRASGYRVAEIQDYLCLSCPQPIYRWMQGKALPSLQHLYALSFLLGVPVDSLLVRRKDRSRNSLMDDSVLLFYIDDPVGKSLAPGKHLLTYKYGLF